MSLITPQNEAHYPAAWTSIFQANPDDANGALSNHEYPHPPKVSASTESAYMLSIRSHLCPEAVQLKLKYSVEGFTAPFQGRFM